MIHFGRRTFGARNWRSWVSIGCVAALSPACSEADVRIRPIADNPRAWVTDLFEHGPRQLTHVAVRDSTTWLTFWRDSTDNRGKSVPVVDFLHYTVLVFADGDSLASSDPPPEFRGAMRVADTLLVRVRREANCGPGTDDLVFHWVIGRVPRHDGPVIFDFEFVPCGEGQPTVRKRFHAG